MFSATQKDLSKASCSLHKDACECAEEAGRKVREVVDQVSHQWNDTQADIVHSIRKNPIKASAIAVGIGFILGALARR